MVILWGFRRQSRRTVRPMVARRSVVDAGKFVFLRTGGLVVAGTTLHRQQRDTGWRVFGRVREYSLDIRLELVRYVRILAGME